MIEDSQLCDTLIIFELDQVVNWFILYVYLLYWYNFGVFSGKTGGVYEPMIPFWKFFTIWTVNINIYII